MLRNLSAIKGYGIVATDGDIGTVKDFLFEDTDWLVRWLVIETGSFLSERKVLLPPSAVTFLDTDRRQLTVGLSISQVENSPDVSTDLPVSRQLENSIYDFYGWNPYWGQGIYPGGFGFVRPAPQELPAPGSWREAQDTADDRIAEGDSHLRSIAAVTGYHIEGSDGQIGHVADFLVQDTEWRIGYLLIDTRNWLPGKEVLISPRSVVNIDWAEKTVEIKATRQAVTESPRYDSTPEIPCANEHEYQILNG